MKNDSILFVGLDTHKAHTEVAYVIDVRENSPQHFDKILAKNKPLLNLTVIPFVKMRQSAKLRTIS